MAKLPVARGGAQPSARKRVRSPDWIAPRLRHVAAVLNAPEKYQLVPRAAPRLWAAWQRVVRDPRGVPVLVDALKHAGRLSRTLVAVVTPDGTIGVGTQSPQAEAVWPAVELLDFAVKSGTPGQVLHRLRHCAHCGTFFDGGRRRRTGTRDLCSRDCRTAVERVPEPRDQMRERIAAWRRRRAGMDAPPGRCRDSRVSTRTGWSQRVGFLRERHGLSARDAETVAQTEVDRIDRQRR